LLYIIGDVSNVLLNNLNLCSNLIYNDILNDNLIANLIPIKIYSNADVLKTKRMFENKNKSGIYRWVNNINGKSYIGSAVDLSNRITRYYNYKNI